MTSFVTLNGMFRFLLMSSSQLSYDISINPDRSSSMPTWTIPALFTRTSILPKSFITAPTVALTCFLSMRSAMYAFADTPSAFSSSALSYILSDVEIIAISAPSPPKILAVLKPIPDALPAPVTRQT